MLIVITADGKCAIEPYLQSGVFKTYNTARNFNLATNKIIHDCVDDGTHRGGAGISVGTLGDVSYIVAHYENAVLIS